MRYAIEYSATLKDGERACDEMDSTATLTEARLSMRNIRRSFSAGHLPNVESISLWIRDTTTDRIVAEG